MIMIRRSNKRSNRPKRGNNARGDRILSLNRMPSGRQTVMPPKFRTVESCVYQGYSTVANGNKAFAFFIYGNGMSHPFASGTPPSTAGNTAGGFTINPGTGTETQANLAYAGDSDLAASFYEYYKILRSRIELTAFPQSTGDELNLTVTAGQSNAVSNVADPILQSMQPFARIKMCSTGNNMRQNTVINQVTTSEVLGMSKAQFEAMPPTPVKTYPNATTNGLWYWAVTITFCDGANFAGIVSITAKITSEIEYSQLGLMVTTE
jgi:hypothetical protein